MCFGGGRARRNSAPARTSAAPPPPARRPAAEGSAHALPTARRSSTFAAIPDTFETLPEVQAALRARGLRTCSLIVAIDYTKSNEWTGKRAFNGRCMHATGGPSTPYEAALAVIGRTLEPFDDDGQIPAFGFGDATTGDAAVFHFWPGGAPARGFDALLARYRQLSPAVTLAGPTSFGPAIRAAAAATLAGGNAFTVLLLLADGQVTRSADVPRGQLSPQEADTAAALVEASRTAALVVIMVGLGDGPWAMMREFDDALPQRDWDNWQFVEYGAATRGVYGAAADASFALACLQEVPEAYATCARLGLLGRTRARAPAVRILPPPLLAAPLPASPQQSFAVARRATAPAAPPPQPARRASAPAMPSPGAQAEAAACAICLDAPRDAVLVPCGHAALCFACAGRVMATSRRCPVCRATASTHVRLFM